MQRYFFEIVDNFFCVFLAFFLQLQKIILHLCVNKETTMEILRIELRKYKSESISDIIFDKFKFHFGYIKDINKLDYKKVKRTLYYLNYLYNLQYKNDKTFTLKNWQIVAIAKQFKLN